MKGAQEYYIDCTDGSTLSSGDYFEINTPSEEFYADIVLNGSEADPKPVGKKRIKIDILSSDTDEQVASKVSEAIIRVKFNLPNALGKFSRAWNHGNEDHEANDPYASLRRYSVDFPSYGFISINGDSIGSFQDDDTVYHTHKLNGPWQKLASASPYEASLYGHDPAGAQNAGETGFKGQEGHPKNYYVLVTIQR